MEFFVEPIPVWAMCYLINGDNTGLSTDDIQTADKRWNENNVQTISLVDEPNGETYPYFSHFPAFGLATEVMDCHVMTL